MLTGADVIIVDVGGAWVSGCDVTIVFSGCWDARVSFVVSIDGLDGKAVDVCALDVSQDSCVGCCTVVVLVGD